MLKLKAFELEIYNTRANKDRRKKVDRYIVSYIDDAGIEYRKSFEFLPGIKPKIPDIINQ